MLAAILLQAQDLPKGAVPVYPIEMLALLLIGAAAGFLSGAWDGWAWNRKKRAKRRKRKR